MQGESGITHPSPGKVLQSWLCHAPTVGKLIQNSWCFTVPNVNHWQNSSQISTLHAFGKTISDLAGILHFELVTTGDLLNACKFKVILINPNNVITGWNRLHIPSVCSLNFASTCNLYIAEVYTSRCRLSIGLCFPAWNSWLSLCNLNFHCLYLVLYSLFSSTSSLYFSAYCFCCFQLVLCSL